MFWEIFYTATLKVIFGEVLDSVYAETRGDGIPGSFCVPVYIIEFYGDTAVVAVVVANMTPNTACIAFKLDQIK